MSKLEYRWHNGIAFQTYKTFMAVRSRIEERTSACFLPSWLSGCSAGLNSGTLPLPSPILSHSVLEHSLRDWEWMVRLVGQTTPAQEHLLLQQPCQGSVMITSATWNTIML